MAIAALIVSHLIFWAIATVPALLLYAASLWLLTPHAVGNSWQTLRGCVGGAFQ
jgi:hypothetical protein